MSVTIPPAIDSAVHTTPPITIEAMMPAEPFKPIDTKIPDEIISVISVIPDTGLEPTIAMALAATVVNRKAITATTRNATTVCTRLWITPT